MFPSLADVIAAIEDLRDRGAITAYAIAGAFALSLWDEVDTTFDLDVLVLLAPGRGDLVDLAPIYEWARERGYAVEAEHIVISGVPVQFMPAPDELAAAAVREARVIDGNGTRLHVVAPEYLAAMWLQPGANTARRKARIEQMRESGSLDQARLQALVERYNLSG